MGANVDAIDGAGASVVNTILHRQGRDYKAILGPVYYAILRRAKHASEPFRPIRLENAAWAMERRKRLDVTFPPITNKFFREIVAGSTSEAEQMIISKSVAIDERYRFGEPIHVAAEHGRLDMAAMLVQNGAQVNARDNTKKQPIHKAVQQGDVKMVLFLLSNGADASARDMHGNQPLHIATDLGHAKIAEILIQHGARVSDQNRFGNQPIHCVRNDRGWEVLKVLLNGGANPEAYNKQGKQLIHIAAKIGNERIVALLLQCHVKVNASTLRKGREPLHEAARRGNANIVEMLLHHGACPYAYDIEDRHPIHFAAQKYCKSTWRSTYWESEPGQHEYILVVNLLLCFGAKVDACDLRGMQPMHYAAIRGHAAVVPVLIHWGASPQCRDLSGTLPITYARLFQVADGHYTPKSRWKEYEALIRNLLTCRSPKVISLSHSQLHYFSS